MSGACGSCTLCCTLKKVEFPDATKPEFTACQHLGCSGCSIYQDRPAPCRAYECLWLQSQRRPDRLPGHMRPDRTGIVLEANTKGNIIATCTGPEVWKREPMRSRLVSWVQRGATVLIKSEGRAVLLRKDGQTDELEQFGVDPTTNENLFRRTG